MDDVPENRDSIKYCWNDKDRVCDTDCIAYWHTEYNGVFCAAVKSTMKVSDPAPVKVDN